MMREHVGDVGSFFAVALFQCLSRLLVQRGALRREQRAVQRVLHQRVVEGIVGGRAAPLAVDAEDQPVLLELRHKRHDLAVELGHLLDEAHRELPPEHRGRLQEPDRVRGRADARGP